ncbi:hypothetical protein HBI59_134160 [Parastagonospora nodorum]|nr:hypothetical protein HBI59_134160 [Parastagonospora nodorum]
MIIFHFLRRSSCTHEQFLSFALQKFLYARTVPFVCFAKVPLRTNSSFTHKQFLYAQTVPLRTNSSFHLLCRSLCRRLLTHGISGCPKSHARTRTVPFVSFLEVFAEVPFVFFAEVFAEVFTEVFAEDCEPMKFRAARSLTHQPSFLFSL